MLATTNVDLGTIVLVLAFIALLIFIVGGVGRFWR